MNHEKRIELLEAEVRLNTQHIIVLKKLVIELLSIAIADDRLSHVDSTALSSATQEYKNLKEELS